MNTRIILLFGVILVLFSSCVKYLDPLPNGDISDTDLWKFQERVQGLVGRPYDNMPRLYNDNEGVYLDGATDDAVITSSTQAMKRLGTGSMTTGIDPFLTFWNRDYQSIYLVNMFLKDRRGYNTKYLVNATWNDLVRKRLQGEAYALRAWFQWDLLQKFGGKGVNGQMLGFPIVKEPFAEVTGVNLARNSYDDCVKQIIADCDSAYKYLPIAHRDYLVPNVSDRIYAGGKYWGRMDGITTRAIKAMVYLTWASPRFNTTNDISRWDSAASNAKKVMDFKLNFDGVQTNGFKAVNRMNWFDPNSPAVVFSARFTATSDVMERMFYPGNFQGTGSVGATQELVNSFPMKNGYPINDPANRGLYSATDPYKDRDPRFYSTIFHNGAQAKKSTGVLMYTFENWVNGGKDAAGITSLNSLTNYHIKKMVFMDLNWGDNVINRQPHAKFFIGWTHMCLTFAEAANQVVGPTDAAKYGISARTAIQYLRTRKTTDDQNGISTVVPPGAPDAYLTEVAAAGKTAFDVLVKNERRIETCFEGMRFYDLRRWTTDLTEINKSVHGAGVTRNPDGVTFTYNLNYEVEPRTFSSAYLPIPYSEILRMSNLVQNEGWDGWN